MRKVFSLFLATALVFMVTAPAFALPAPVEKLSSGVVKIVKSPLAIFDHTKTEMKGHTSKTIGFTKGLIESPFFMLKDIGGGLMDIITFPMD